MPAAALLIGLSLLAIAAAIVPAIASQAPADEPGAPDPAAGSGELTAADVAALVPDVADVPAAIESPHADLLEQFGVTLRAMWTPPAAAAPYLDLIARASADNALPEGLLARTLYEESRFRPEIIDGTIRSKAGAIGIAQFMPATARAAGIDATDPQQAIPAAAAELAAMYHRFGSWAEALAAYNWGQGNLGRKGVGAEPAETRRYVAAIAGDVGLAD